MNTKKREQILLEPNLQKRLQKYASQTGLAKTEIIRQALDDYLWDKQIEDDLNTGRLDGILVKAKKQSEQDKSTPL